MTLVATSPCKVNLLLNILGRRQDGFHELETVFMPVPLTDRLTFERAGAGVQLTCSHPELPVDSGNLVYRAAESFLAAAGLSGEGVRIHLEKRLPLAAGIGGGSANAAVTLRSLDRLFGQPLEAGRLHELAAGLGSDVPFFLQDEPALASGRGEQVVPLTGATALKGCGVVLVHPGFGVSTPWAYRALGDHPEALQGRPGRAEQMARHLCAGNRDGVLADLYNALEAPVLVKYPLLRVIQEFFRAEGALGTLMSGSGSTTFAVTADAARAEALAERFRGRFGDGSWIATAVW